MKTVTLSGWGQPHDALSLLGGEAIDYAHAASAEEAIRMIAALAKDAERVIGWSLGGQLAVRAVAQGAIAPKQLVLIAAPYQFVSSDATGRETFEKFHGNYQRNPKRTLDKAWELVHYEDARSDYIRDQLAAFDKDAVLKKDWLRWLTLLAHFNCDTLDLSALPNTLIVHGRNDVVVPHVQASQFAKRINNAKLDSWEACGHAPHFHDTKRLRNLIESHANV